MKSKKKKKKKKKNFCYQLKVDLKEKNNNPLLKTFKL